MNDTQSNDQRDRFDRFAASDEPLPPVLRGAVAALRALPPTSPDAVARVVAAATRHGAAGARPRRLRVRVAGASAAVAAGLAVAVFGRPHRAPGSLAASATPSSTPALSYPPSPSPSGRMIADPHATPMIVARVGAATADAPRLVTFRLLRPGATAVTVVGDFNEWNARATPLARDGAGAWTASVALSPGRHAYRFVVDDSLRVLDPRAPAERDAELGVARSVIVVGVP